MAKPSGNEPTVRFHHQMPNDYVFVPKGSVYITGNCRRQTVASGQQVYTVVNKKNQTIGIRVPQQIHSRVCASEAETRALRASAVAKKDGAMEHQFATAVTELFPQTPEASIPLIVATAMKKGSGRVGRTGKLDIRKKATLAVRAHIRHCHTNYDELLKTGMDRKEARKKIFGKLGDVAKEWAGLPPDKKGARKNQAKSEKQKKTKVIEKENRVTKSKAKAKVSKAKATKTDTKVVINTFSGSESPLRSRRLSIQKALNIPSSPPASPKPRKNSAGKSLQNGSDDDDESDEFQWPETDDDVDEDGDVEMTD